MSGRVGSLIEVTGIATKRWVLYEMNMLQPDLKYLACFKTGQPDLKWASPF